MTWNVTSYEMQLAPFGCVEAFVTNLFNSWGIGDRQRNDGVLLLVATNDRKVRIEVGSGYGAGYDSAMQRVIDDNILPFFRRGEDSEGIASGVRGIKVALTTAPSGSSAFLSSPPVVGGVLIVGFVVVIGITKAGLRLYRRRRIAPRPHVVICKDCRRPMDELGIDLVNADLHAGQQVERQLGSVNYQLWESSTQGQRRLGLRLVLSAR